MKLHSKNNEPSWKLDRAKLLRGLAPHLASTAIAVWGGPHLPRIEMAEPISPNTLGVSGAVDNSPELGVALDKMHQHGADAFRFDIGWPGVEPNVPEGGVHTYNWSGTDAAMATLLSHGMTPYPVAGYAPRWASGQDNEFGPPTDPQQYAAFIKHLIDRYSETDTRVKGAFWQENPHLPYKPIRRLELWNEINYKQFFRDNGSTPELDYLRLYEAARDAINLEHKNVTVVFGSLLDSAGLDAIAYLQRLNRQSPGSIKRVEAVAIHPYYSTADQVINRLIQFRIALNKMGAQNTEIDVTEFGTFGDVASPQQSAEMLRKLVKWLNSGCNKEANKIEKLIPYGFMGGQGETMPGGSYALFNQDSQPTTTGRAFLSATAIATTKRQKRRCDPIKNSVKKVLKNSKYKKNNKRLHK